MTRMTGCDAMNFREIHVENIGMPLRLPMPAGQGEKGSSERPRKAEESRPLEGINVNADATGNTR